MRKFFFIVSLFLLMITSFLLFFMIEIVTEDIFAGTFTIKNSIITDIPFIIFLIMIFGFSYFFHKRSKENSFSFKELVIIMPISLCISDIVLLYFFPYDYFSRFLGMLFCSLLVFFIDGKCINKKID